MMTIKEALLIVEPTREQITAMASDLNRSELARVMKTALTARVGNDSPWSVTGGRGTAYGWLHITAPPARRIWRRS